MLSPRISDKSRAANRGSARAIEINKKFENNRKTRKQDEVVAPKFGRAIVYRRYYVHITTPANPKNAIVQSTSPEFPYPPIAIGEPASPESIVLYR